MSVFTIAERLERLPLTGYQRTLFFIIATAWLFDCVDFAMMTFVLSSIKKEFSLDTATAGALGSAGFIGMFFGAASAGMLADKYGRCVVFRWSMVIWGLGSLACAFAPNPLTLMICRIILGVGMSMELPVGQSLICEYIPTAKRGRYIALLEGFWPVGFVLAGVLAYFILPVWGWRGVFVAEAIPALFVLIVRQIVPESPRWLSDAGRMEQAEAVMSKIESKVRERLKGQSLPEPKHFAIASGSNKSNNGNSLTGAKPKAPYMELWSEKFKKRTAMLWTLWFFVLLGYYGLTTWLGELLVEHGFSNVKSNEYITLISLAGVPGFATSAWLIEKIGRKPTTVTMLLGCAVTAFLYGNAPNLTFVIVFGLAMQFFMFGMWSAIYAYTPELYPTRARATGTGFASSIGRIGALLGPYLVGVILPHMGQHGVFALGALSFVVAALVVAAFGEETRGRVLEEI